VFEKLIARSEAWAKGMAFDCQACGQCVLRQTGLICPMSCPKGLRNGPCGGTINGACEVYPDKQCVWIRIHNRISRDLSTPDLLPSPDSALYNTSSYINYFNGRDKLGTTALTYLELGKNRTALPAATDSKLELKLKQGLFVKTCEIRSPRNPDFRHFDKEAELIRDHFDAVNVTAFLNGKPSLPSPRACAELVGLGIEPICQSTARDHTKTSFVSELLQNHLNGVNNLLCITGDSYKGEPKIKQVYDMDSSLMLYEARYLRQNGEIHFTAEELSKPPSPFLGAAINPFTQPAEVPIRRLKQKAAAGADFIQTQFVFDVESFQRFMSMYRQEKLDEELFLLAGIPVVISTQALNMIPHIPGVLIPDDLMQELQSSPDLRSSGIQLARDLVQSVRKIPGVNGVHLMLLGSDHAVLKDIID
jgi:methylenetetrahydrofolate reductase (NADPH)